MSFRKEQKFRLTQSDQQLLKVQLQAKGMTQLYPERGIQSCYFDTINLTLFWQSEEGVLPRKKVRLRWYDDPVSLTKEVKHSSVEGRFKTTEPYKTNTATQDFKNIELHDPVYGRLIPTVCVSYQREYFMLNQLRITFDRAISYQDMRSFGRRVQSDPETVMEIKTNIDTPDDYINSVVPYPTTRFSKYCRALLAFEQNLR